MSVAIRITADSATGAMQQIQQATALNNFANEMGPRMTRMVQQHFLGLAKNKQGFHSLGFWRKAAGATNWQADGGGVVVDCNQIGVRQRYYGGDIKPVNKQALTLPACDAAYGHTASEFKLQMSMQLNPVTGRIQSCLIMKEPGKGRKRKGAVAPAAVGQVMFWLVKGVHQMPNTAIIPSDAEFNYAINKGLQKMLSAI